jgi:hypothetical protein
MILLAKVALGFGATVAVAGAYSFRQGVIRVDVDEFRPGGSHVHFWVPAAIVPTVMRFIPQDQLRSAMRDRDCREAREAMPIVRAMFHELRNYPNTVFVEVTDGDQHVRVATESGRLAIDVTEPSDNVHLRVPISTVEETFAQLERAATSVSLKEAKEDREDKDWQ